MSITVNFTVARQEPVQNITSEEAGTAHKLLQPYGVFWGNECKSRCALVNA